MEPISIENRKRNQAPSTVAAFAFVSGVHEHDILRYNRYYDFTFAFTY